MRWLRRVAIAGGAAVVTLVLAEVVIQLVGDPRERAAAERAEEKPAYWELARSGLLAGDDEALRFRLAPGFAGTVGGIEYRVNELGLRGPPVARAKPQRGRRVLVLGDSYVFGLGVREEETMARRLEELLREERGDGGGGRGDADGARAGAAVEVLNLGVPGYHTGQELALLERAGFALAPDVVVLVYYANDNVEAALHLAPSIRALYVDELPLPYTWKATLSRSYLYSQVAKLDAARRFERGDFDALGTRSWPVTAARLRRIAAACRERGVAFLLAALPALTTTAELNDAESEVVQDHERVLALAREEAWPHVDLRSGVLARTRRIERLFLSLRPLDAHLNPEGHRLVAELLAPAVRRLLPP